MRGKYYKNQSYKKIRVVITDDSDIGTNNDDKK